MKTLQTISCEEIMATPIAPIPFSVENLFGQGLYLFAGAPKIGKSWLSLDICLSVAKGEAVLGQRTAKGTALYLCLEDNKVRLQNRLYELTNEPTDSLYFSLLADTIGDGLEQQIEQFYLAHRDLKIVVIDTLQKIRSSEESAYGTDYTELASLKRLADKLAITILLVHHTRKCKDSDPFNMISGSTGLRGGADGALVLIEKDRATHEATLYCEGRDIESRELKLQRTAHRWELTDKINLHTKKQYIPNVVSRKILQSAQRLLEQDVLFEMKRSNGIRKIQAQYFGDNRDDSDDKTDASLSSAVDPVRNVGTA